MTPVHPIASAVQGFQAPEIPAVLELDPDVRARGGLVSLVGGKPPPKEIQQEKGAHRVMAYLYAQGMSQRAIAEQTGYSEQQVSVIVRQPWFKQNVAEIIRENYDDNVANLIKGGAVEAVMTMRELLENPNAAVRHKAAADLLDRFRGKPTQHVHHSTSEVPVDAQEEIERLREETQKL